MLLGVAHRAGLFLDRDAGVVADALPHASERGEQRRLPGVGIADEGNANRFGGGDGHELGGVTTETRSARRIQQRKNNFTNIESSNSIEVVFLRVLRISVVYLFF